jgi:hypothetical protein
MNASDGTTKSTSLDREARLALYPDDLSVREARARYFARSGFTAATYTDPWVALPLGPVTIRLPNFAARKKAVKVHDLNHILTGYGTDWHGEFCASGFELGMGIGRSWAAWMINAGGAAGGLLRAPRDVVRAYARGRAARASTYDLLDPWDDAVLDQPLRDLRARVAIPDDATAGLRDVVALAGHAVLGAAIHLAPVVVAVVAVAALIGPTG